MEDKNSTWIIIIIVIIVIVVLVIWISWVSCGSSKRKTRCDEKHKDPYSQRESRKNNNKQNSLLYSSSKPIDNTVTNLKNNILEYTKPIDLTHDAEYEIILPKNAMNKKYTVVVEINISERILSENTPAGGYDARTDDGYVVSMYNNVSNDNFIYDTSSSPVILPPAINRKTKTGKSIINLEANSSKNICLKFKIQKGSAISGYIKAEIYSHGPLFQNKNGLSIHQRVTKW